MQTADFNVFNGKLATSSLFVSSNVLAFDSSGGVVNVATGTVQAGSGITVTGNQSVIGSGLTITNTIGYPFAGTGNSTTTGIGIFASTTIGAGTRVGGLTISGSATTTGNFFVWANIATSTIPNNNPFAWTIATTTGGNASSTLFRIDTTSAAEKVIIGYGSSDVIIGDSGAGASLVFEENSTIKGQGSGRTLTFGANSDIFNWVAPVTVANSTAFSVGSTTAAGSNPSFRIIQSSTGATSTVGFFVSTTTLLSAGSGVAAPSALQNYVIVGNGFNQAGIGIVNGGLCVDNDGWCTASTTGRISSVTSTTGGTDLAEIYVSTSTLAAGNIVATDGLFAIKAAEGDTTHQVIGIVSTDPGFILGLGPDQASGGNRYPVALAGRVPTKVNLDNGPISVGDRITLSTSTPGTGMRAGPWDASVAIALEAFAPSTTSTATTTTILGFISLQAVDQNALADALASSTATTSAQALVAGSFAQASQTLKDALTSALSAIANIAQAGILELGVAVHASVGIFDKVFAHEVHTDNLCITKSDGTDVCVTGDQLSALLSGQTAAASTNMTNTTPSSTSGSTSDSTSTAPVLSVNGNNPATVDVGSTYSDLGATITGPASDLNLGIYASVDGATTTAQDQVVIDTSVAGAHTIIYSATDQNGLTGSATRTVNVVDATSTTP